MKAFSADDTAPGSANQNPRGLRHVLDRIAGVCVRASGITIVLNIFLIFVLIVVEVLPLWRPAHVEVRARFSASIIFGGALTHSIVAIGCEEQRQIGYALDDSGVFHFYALEDGRELSRAEIPGLFPARITSVWQSLNGGKIAAGTSDGRVFIGAVDFMPEYGVEGYVFAPGIDFEEGILLDSSAQPVRQLAVAEDPGRRRFIAGITADHRIVTYTKGVLKSDQRDANKAVVHQLPPVLEARPARLAINDSFEDFFVGTESGLLLHYSFSSLAELTFQESLKASEKAITTLGFLLGGRSLVVGDAGGNTSVYFSVPDAETKRGRRVRRIHELQPLDGAVVAQAASPRNRTFLAAAATGEIGLYFSTNERLLFQDYVAQAPVAAAIFSPKADGLLLMDATQTIYDVAFHNPHPEANWKAFFQKIWYEGYEHPEYVWQSSGPDDFEAKISVIPLILGTLKGTLYAMLFALPLSIGAALYVSQFMHHRFRSIFKPVIETMATLPSVVLGFLAALWLAPLLEKIFPAVLLMIVTLPLMIMLVAILWGISSRFIPGLGIATGKEALLIAPMLLAGTWLCLQLNGVIESGFFGGDFKQWLIEVTGIVYDQRNAFVVGLAMAFAVIPVIFTIAEEALSNVPARLTAASLALGATPWQTAVLIILPAAGPGILAAMMIGFGRAVGETMIVLMATGNTPIMDFSIFNGFRTLSANLAVEMPESPVGGTLFRALFLAALLLFLMTFMTNTVAELVRQRMREKLERL